MHRNHTNIHTWPGIGSILLLFLGLTLGNSQTPAIAPISTLGGSFSVGITGPLTADLRAEETREGRTDTLTIKTIDAAGNCSVGTARWA